MLRKSQLIQSGVTVDDGPTLEEIRANESTQEEDHGDGDVVSEDKEDIDSGSNNPDLQTDPETPTIETANSDNETPTDYESTTVVQLKELLKSAGKPVSGKKAD